MTKDSSDDIVTGNIVTIVEIGGEGGSITLDGRRDADGHWQFRMATNEAALWDMLDEEPPPQEEAPWVSSLAEALTLLDRYPWPQLHPVDVHPEFREAVFTAVAEHPKGGREQVERWRHDLDLWSRLR